MSKINILNLVLFIVVISLAFIIYFSEEQNTRLQQLTDINPNDIALIKIQHNKNSTVINRLSDKQWQITRPVSVAANNFRISSLIELVVAPVHNQYDVSEIDIDKIGLAKPKTSIQFDDNTVAFGVINAATNLRYIRVNQSIYTIEDVYYPLISSHFSTLVSLNLLPANSAIEKLVLINQTIAKDDKGLWRSNIGMSADNIAKAIDHWQHNQAFGVHAYLQRDELGEVFIYLKDIEQPVRYIITDIEPWLILARPDTGLEYHLDIAAYDQLIRPVEINNNTKIAP